MLTEVSQRGEDKCHIISLTVESKNKTKQKHKLIHTERKLVVPKERGVGEMGKRGEKDKRYKFPIINKSQ